MIFEKQIGITALWRMVVDFKWGAMLDWMRSERSRVACDLKVSAVRRCLKDHRLHRAIYLSACSVSWRRRLEGDKVQVRDGFAGKGIGLGLGANGHTVIFGPCGLMCCAGGTDQLYVSNTAPTSAIWLRCVSCTIAEPYGS